MPRVSIISCFYNRADLVERTVASLLAQTYLDCEILLVNDGSRDDTLEKMRAFGDPRIRIIDHPNMGFTASMVDAIGQSKGDYIAILGSGDEAFPERIEKQATHLDQNTDIVAVGVRFKLHHSADNVSLSRETLGDDPHHTLLTTSIYGHSEVMFRKSTYLEVGGYREFFKFSQDNDLWLRLSERGRLSLVPEVLQSIYKLDDGVTVAPDKMLMSKRCRDFAVHCARERRAGRPDPLAKHGPVAALARPRSKHLGGRLLKDAVRFMLADQPGEAEMFLRAAADEGYPLRARLMMLMLVYPRASKFILSRMYSLYRAVR